MLISALTPRPLSQKQERGSLKSLVFYLPLRGICVYIKIETLYNIDKLMP